MSSQQTADDQRLLAAADKLEQAMAILSTRNDSEVRLRRRIAKVVDAANQLAYSKHVASRTVRERCSPDRDQDRR